jgi:hypothetical protein
MSMENKVELLAHDIYDFCQKNDLWGDNCIYFNGIALASWPEWAGVKGEPVMKDLYLYNDKDPKDYFQYVREPNILSMSFEGPLNHVLNAYVHGWSQLEAKFMKIFKKYGYYYEMGNSWNLTVYKD